MVFRFAKEAGELSMKRKETKKQQEKLFRKILEKEKKGYSFRIVRSRRFYAMLQFVNASYNKTA